jgi:predicted Ser/Thr protein kinase
MMGMTTPEAHLAGLSDDQRQLLETWLVEFDLSWDEGRLAASARRLPPRGNPLRRPVLIEMVKIDLERRWQRGQRARLEAYVKALPELGGPDGLPADLLLAEYELLQQCGAPADVAEFARRFPRQADELRRLVEQARDEADGAPAAAPLETLRSGIHGTDAASLAPSPRQPGAAPSPGWLGRYRIVRELGRGAMGTVYLAHDSQLDRLVALKVPRFSDADGPEVRQRFLREARAAATIEHPNVCPVYDVGEVGGTPYLTMAYLPGEPLSQRLAGQKCLPARRAASLVRQLADALQAAHERGVIHRDLKPSNIILNPRGDPVILDFGLARRMQQEAHLTQLGQPLGTPAYMAPEQVTGAVGLMGPGCDIYALGVILYQLLTGRLPFEGPVAEVLARIVAQPPEPPSKYRPDVDPRLEEICLKALSKDVAGRHASMRDLGAALGECLRRSQPPVAVLVAPGARLPRPARWLLLGGGGLAVIALALLAWAIRGADPTGSVRIETDDPGAEVELRVDGEPVAAPAVNGPLRLPAGKHHLLVTGKKVQPVSTSFTVIRGENPALRVQLVPRSEAVADPVPPPDAPPRRHRDRHDDDERDDD